MKKLVLLVCVLACTAAAGLLHHSGRLDRTPPRIELQVPDGPLSGDVAVEINVADLTPGLSEVRLSVDDGPPQRLDIDPSGHTTWTWPGGPGRPPGPHTLRVQATDSAWKPNTAELSIQRTTDDQPPELRFKLVPDRPAQGTVAALFVWADEPLSSVQIDGWRTSQSSIAAFRFSSVEDSYASRTGRGRDVGVIGFAFFSEAPHHEPPQPRYAPPPPPDYDHQRERANPFPGR